VNTLFPQTADVKTAYLLVGDFTRRLFPLVPYRKLLTQVQELDDVHGEIVETAKRWADPLQLRAFVKPDEIIQPMLKFGVENFRVVTLFASVPDLVTSGLATQDKDTFEVKLLCGIGDRFEYSRQSYSVIELVPSARWGNTDVILHFVMRAELYRTTSDGLL